MLCIQWKILLGPSVFILNPLIHPSLSSHVICFNRGSFTWKVYLSNYESNLSLMACRVSSLVWTVLSSPLETIWIQSLLLIDLPISVLLPNSDLLFAACDLWTKNKIADFFFFLFRCLILLPMARYQYSNHILRSLSFFLSFFQIFYSVSLNPSVSFYKTTSHNCTSSVVISPQCFPP